MSARKPAGFVGQTPHGRPLLVRTEESAQSWISVGATMEPLYRRTPEDVETLLAAAEWIGVCGQCSCDDCKGAKELAAKLRELAGE